MLTGKTLKVIRTIKGLTQKQLAEAAGVQQMAISEFESGTEDKPRSMKSDTILKLCAAMGVGISYAVDGQIIQGP